jgi:hypothetical protein
MTKIKSAVSDIVDITLPIIMRNISESYRGSNLCVLFTEFPDVEQGWQGVVLNHTPINGEQPYSLGFSSQNWTYPRYTPDWEVFRGTLSLMQE